MNIQSYADDSQIYIISSSKSKDVGRMHKSIMNFFLNSSFKTKLFKNRIIDNWDNSAIIKRIFLERLEIGN